MYSSAPTRFERFGAVSCAPPPAPSRGGPRTSPEFSEFSHADSEFCKPRGGANRWCRSARR
eukprot:351734-Alexandrium_andersonii.AAC.1